MKSQMATALPLQLRTSSPNFSRKLLSRWFSMVVSGCTRSASFSGRTLRGRSAARRRRRPRRPRGPRGPRGLRRRRERRRARRLRFRRPRRPPRSSRRRWRRRASRAHAWRRSLRRRGGRALPSTRPSTSASVTARASSRTGVGPRGTSFSPKSGPRRARGASGVESRSDVENSCDRDLNRSVDKFSKQRFEVVHRLS